jgi:hypothetical protein|nr:MAG TPA: Neuraminidase [Caudoviricetes sp.]
MKTQEIGWGSFSAEPVAGDQSKLLCEGYVFDDMGEETIEVDPQNQLDSIVKLASKRGARITDMIVLHNQIDVDWEACDCAFGYQGIGCMCNDGWQGRVTRFV